MAQRIGGYVQRPSRRDVNEKEIVDALRKIGASVSRLKDRDLNARGLPDLLVGYKGKTILIEVKSEKGRVNEGQKEWHRNWQGDAAYVVSSADQAVKLCNAVAD